jgi:hypothetical protein
MPAKSKYKFSIILLLLPYVYGKAQSTQVPMHQVGGVYMVDCTLNTIPLKFIFDSGASTCQIGLTEALFLFKNGHLTEEDVLDDVQLRIADGSSIEGLRINIESLVIGDIRFMDVDAVIVKELDAPLLLGQNILSSNTLVVIDYDNLMLHFLDDERAEFISGVIYDETDYKAELKKERQFQSKLSSRLDSLRQVRTRLTNQIKQLEKDKKTLADKAEQAQNQLNYTMQSNIVLKDVDALSTKIDRVLKKYGKRTRTKEFTTVYSTPSSSSPLLFYLPRKERIEILEETPLYKWVYVPKRKRCGYIVK